MKWVEDCDKSQAVFVENVDKKTSYIHALSAKDTKPQEEKKVLYSFGIFIVYV